MSNPRAAVAQVLTIESTDELIVIRDLCMPGRMSVTNDIENIVREAFATGVLKPGMRLHYYDSDNRKDEIIVKDGKFAGFKPLPQEEK